MSISGPLKTALNITLTNVRGNVRSNFFKLVEWAEAFIKARSKAFRTPSIITGFVEGDIVPFNPEILLSTLESPLRTPSPKDTSPTQVREASRVLRISKASQI